MNLRTFCEAKSDINRFFGSFEDSPGIKDAKLSHLTSLSGLQEEDKVLKCDLSGRVDQLLRLRAELENDTEMEETERCEKLHSCCWDLGRLRCVKETVLNFSLEFNTQEKSCDSSPLSLPDYTQRTDTFLSLFREELDEAPNSCLRVCVDEKDNLYLTSGREKSIYVYDKDMQLLRQFKNEQLSWPYSMAVKHQCLFVTEWDSSSLLKFSLDGVLLGRAVGLDFPSGLAVSENRLLYVACTNIIHVFSHDLDLITHFNAVPHPCDVKLTKDNTLLVLDRGGELIHWFSLQGEYGKIATGCDNNQLFLNVDKFDNVLLSDYSRGSIQVYSHNLQLTAELDNKGRKQTLQNRSLAVRDDGIIVCVSESDPFLNFF